MDKKLTRKSKDDWEDARLEEENNHEHADASPVGGVGVTRIDTNGGGDEDDDGSLESEQHPTRLETEVHDTSCSKTTDGEESLSNGIKVGTLAVTLVDAQLWVGFSEVVDKVLYMLELDLV